MIILEEKVRERLFMFGEDEEFNKLLKKFFTAFGIFMTIIVLLVLAYWFL